MIAIGNARARRRPRTLLALFAWELACAFAIAAPLQAWTARVWGMHPEGDGVLFRPGGLSLVDWVFDEGPALGIVLRSSLVLFFAATVLGQLVFGTVTAALGVEHDDGRSLGLPDALRAGASAFAQLGIVAFVATILQGIVLGGGIFASGALYEMIEARTNDVQATWFTLFSFTVFFVMVLALGVLSDLVRVSLARSIALGERSFRANLATAFRGLAFKKGLVAWAWRAVLATSMIIVGSLAGDAVGGRTGAVLWGLFVFHQALIFGRAALRASWIANALRLQRLVDLLVLPSRTLPAAIEPHHTAAESAPPG